MLPLIFSILKTRVLFFKFLLKDIIDYDYFICFINELLIKSKIIINYNYLKMVIILCNCLRMITKNYSQNK